MINLVPMLMPIPIPPRCGSPVSILELSLFLYITTPILIGLLHGFVEAKTEDKHKYFSIPASYFFPHWELSYFIFFWFFGGKKINGK